MAKFYFFEKTVETFYTHVFTKPKESYSSSTQLGITFASGYIAGIVCAVVVQNVAVGDKQVWASQTAFAETR